MTKNPFVLIVEDDEWMAQQHQRSLEAAGMKTKVVSHALAAMDALDAVRPDVLVLDVLLPGPNAFTLLHELRSHADLAAIPVILCTNSGDQLASDDLSAYGVRRVLDKTKMQPSDLEAVVRRVLL
jgi:PleD family two-component response regulator